MDDQPIRSQKKTFEELLEKELKGTEQSDEKKESKKEEGESIKQRMKEKSGSDQKHTYLKRKTEATVNTMHLLRKQNQNLVTHQYTPKSNRKRNKSTANMNQTYQEDNK